MTALVFVDTNVHLWAADERDRQRQERARQWLTWCWTNRAGRISTQVLNELYYNAANRFGPGALQAARSQIRRLREWQPPHLDAHTIDGAWSLQDRYGLGYWDALILSSAQQQGCAFVLSDALPAASRYESVLVVDPFELTPPELAQLS